MALRILRIDSWTGLLPRVQSLYCKHGVYGPIVVELHASGAMSQIDGAFAWGSSYPLQMQCLWACRNKGKRGSSVALDRRIRHGGDRHGVRWTQLLFGAQALYYTYDD